MISIVFLHDNICEFLTKGALEKVYRFFLLGRPCSSIDDVLLNHKERNEGHLNKPERKILVVANVSAGKSTLINALVGYRLNRAMTTACTNKLVCLHNKTLPDGITTQNEHGDYSYFHDMESINSDKFVNAAFPFNSSLSSENICFIDTPGINNSNDFSHKKITERAILASAYDAVIYVSNCQYFGTNDERALLLFLRDYVRKPNT